MNPIAIADDLSRELLAFPLGDAAAGALFSSSDVGLARFRFLLWRVWDHDRPVLVWCMLNPSKATHEVPDPTVTRCIGWAKRWGFGGVLVINAYAFRATDPLDMLRAPDRIGFSNDPSIEAYSNDIAIEAVLRAIDPALVTCTCNGGSIPVDGGGVTCMTCEGHGWLVPQRLMVAWGDGIERDRAGTMLQLLGRVGVTAYCLGTTRLGNPRHPVRLGYDTPVREWPR